MITKGKSIVSKGKTVKQAVSAALELLSENRDDVDIEIIVNESKGILGLGSREAVVRVTAKGGETAPADEPSAAAESSHPDDLDAWVRSLEMPGTAETVKVPVSSKTPVAEQTDLAGKVWVKDGRIFCKDAPDKYPVVAPAEEMRLFKNGEPVDKTIVVTESDEIKVELEDEVREPEWEVSLSENKMEASIKVVPGAQIFRKLKDAEPNPYIDLHVEERRLPIFIKSEPVMEKLREMGVTHGVNYSEIALACTSEEAVSFVIAKGTAPSPGRDGCFLPLQEIEIKKGIKEMSDGTVDYRELQQYPSVEPGHILGMVQEPIPGTPGRTVTNDPVFPPEVYPLIVQEGRGVVLMEEGTKVVATDAGHPDIKIKGRLAKISVIPKLLIGKDVDMQVGNIRYIGDVEIAGAVQDGMLVDVQGNVLVYNNVNMAKVHAGGSIIVQNNIIGSEVTAGQNSLLISEMNQLLGGLIQQMNQMVTAIQQLSTVSAFKVESFSRTGMGPLIKILCDGKFKGFLPLLTVLTERIKAGSDRLDPEWGEFGESLHKGFMLVHASNFRCLEDISKVVSKAEELFAQTEDDNQESGSFIRAGSAQNSRLYASGNISIVGQGAYHSNLRSGGSVEVEGYVRGGEIFAKQGVVIGEAGTRGGAGTKIVVPNGTTIRIQKAMEDTVIQIGTKKHKFTTETSNVYARLGEDGELLI